jgi:predicted DNA-binding transcriptional regulator AlpA
MSVSEAPVKRLLTVTDVAEFCSIAPETVRRMTERNAMPQPVRLGRAVRYRMGDIESWINAGCPSSGSSS